MKDGERERASRVIMFSGDDLSRLSLLSLLPHSSSSRPLLLSALVSRRISPVLCALRVSSAKRRKASTRKRLRRNSVVSGSKDNGKSVLAGLALPAKFGTVLI